MNANKLLIIALMADSTKESFDKITAKSREREPGGRKPCCAEANNNAPSLAYRHMIGRISYLRSVASGLYKCQLCIHVKQATAATNSSEQLVQERFYMKLLPWFGAIDSW
uniref:Uncharacterized protein n=1 Tax=Glossina palpalis gambiensis TaxID=67801 RepID=A0A1B0B8B0_9MUSC